MRTAAILLLGLLVAVGPAPRAGAEDPAPGSGAVEPAPGPPKLVKRKVLRRTKGIVRCLSFHPVLAILAAGSQDRSLRLWEADGSDLRKHWRIPRKLGGVP